MKFFLILIGCLLVASCIVRFNGSSVVGYCTEEGIDFVEVREVGPFRALSSGLPCNVYFSQAARQEVRIETTEEFADKILTVVEDGTLKLKLQDGNYPKLILRIYISVPAIESITIQGSGNLYQEGLLQVDNNLNLKVSGSGDMRFGQISSKGIEATTSGSGNIDIESLASAGSFSARVSGSGGIRIFGKTAVEGGVELSVSGSGDIDIDSVAASGNASARTTGSGDICLREVVFNGDVDLKTSGSGDIIVNGTCRDVNASTSGSGNISGNLSHAGIRVHSTGSGDVIL